MTSFGMPDDVPLHLKKYKMASSGSSSNDMLNLLKEYTQLKRMIESCKRRNVRRQPSIPLPSNHPSNVMASQHPIRTNAVTPNPYVLRATASRSAPIASKYKMTLSRVVSKPPQPPGTVTLASSKQVIRKPPVSAASKYSWSSSEVAAKQSEPSPVAASTSHQKVIRKKISTKYKVVNSGISPTANRTLRQVRKYSVKYVPLSNRSPSKNSSVKRNPIFVDGRYALRRRRSVSQAEQRLHGQANRRTNFVVIGKLLYKMSKTKLSRTGSAKTGSGSENTSTPSTSTPRISPRSKMAVMMRRRRQSVVTAAARQRIVSVRGVKFVMDPDRKTLRRIAQQPSHPSSSSNLRVGMSRVDIGSETYVQSQPGLLVRSSGKQLRTLANRVVNRSIDRLVVKRQRSQQFCMFYNKFGKCSKRDKTSDGCPYIHDSAKIAVCKRYLKGECKVADCSFSHRLCPLKMPVCVFFLRGRCSSDTCPYRHVNVNRDASVCVDFNRGYCPLGEKCKKWHLTACPQFELNGQCDRGDACPLRHRRQRAKVTNKPDTDTAAPVKPRFTDGPHDEEGSLPAFISLNEFDCPSSSSSTSEGIKEGIIAASVGKEEIRIKPKFVKKLLPPST